MISYVEHSKINKVAWDKCISSSPHGLVYAMSWYLDIVSPGWDALVEDNYQSVFPLTHRKKAGISYLFQPFFTQQLGLFCGEEIISEKKLSDFLNAIPEKFKLVEIQLNAANKINEASGFSIAGRLTHHLNLSDSHENIIKNYSDNLKRNIKKADKSSNNISEGIDPGKIISLFRQNRGSEIGNLKSGDYEMFTKLLKVATEKNLIDSRGILNASKNLIAGAIFLKSLHSQIFLFSATNDEAKESGAMSSLIDSFIRDHSGKSEYLDFEGSMDKNLSRYYKGFGSQEVVYLQIRKNKLPLILRWLK